MGTFQAHFMLGLIPISYGLWYTIQCLRRYHRCQKLGTKFTSSFAYPADFLSGRWKNLPIDSILKIVFTMMVISGDLLTSYVIDHPKSHSRAWFHIASEWPAVLCGLVELLLHCKVPIMDDWDYVANAHYFLVEILAIFFHLHGSLLERRAHVLFVMAATANFLVTVAEAKYRHHVMLPVMRGATLILKGTFTIEIAFILFNPIGTPWDGWKHMNLTLATIHFGWHAIFTMIVATAISVPVALGYRHGRITVDNKSGYIDLKSDADKEEIKPCLCYASEDELDK